MTKRTSAPLVSIAIITYNQIEYLKECIESVLAQDYTDIEIVIADDFSTDGTQDLLKRYAAKHPQTIRLELAEKNQGITTNANIGLLSCTGQYIIMFAGDDCMKPGKIRKQVEFLERNPDIEICGTYVERIDENSDRIDIRKDYKNKPHPRYDLCELIESGNSLVPVVSYMFRRDSIPEGGYDFRLSVASDSLFFFRIASKGDIWIIPEILTSYRVHDSHARRIGYRDDSFVVLALVEYLFPSCYNSIRLAKARLYRRAAISRILDKDYVGGTGYLRSSLMAKFSFKVFLLILFIKIDAGNFVQRLINKKFSR